MKLKILATAALIAAAPAAFAQSGQVPNPADPAPANPRATDGAPTQAPARGGSGRSMSRDTGSSMGTGVENGGGNPAHANGGNGPGGRY